MPLSQPADQVTTPDAPAASPAAAQVPQAPVSPGQPTAVIGGEPVAVPLTRRDVQALESRRSELGRQLSSAVSRRTRVAEELKTETGAGREGLEGRLAVLDRRIMQLEGDIAENGRLLASAPGSALSRNNPDFGPLSSGQITGISVVFIIFVLAPLVFMMARALFRRAGTDVGKAFVHDATQRLNRLEQSVDTIAVEIERISEGQRFVTKVLTNPEAARLRLSEGEERGTSGARREL
jgi:hypothetical protein